MHILTSDLLHKVESCRKARLQKGFTVTAAEGNPRGKKHDGHTTRSSFRMAELKVEDVAISVSFDQWIQAKQVRAKQRNACIDPFFLLWRCLRFSSLGNCPSIFLLPLPFIGCSLTSRLKPRLVRFIRRPRPNLCSINSTSAVTGTFPSCVFCMCVLIVRVHVVGRVVTSAGERLGAYACWVRV